MLAMGRGICINDIENVFEQSCTLGGVQWPAKRTENSLLACPILNKPFLQ